MHLALPDTLPPQPCAAFVAARYPAAGRIWGLVVAEFIKAWTRTLRALRRTMAPSMVRTPLPAPVAGLQAHAQCWLCAGRQLSEYWTDEKATRDYNTRYLRCGRCGLVLVSPYLDDPGLGLDETQHENYVNNVDQYTAAVSVEAFRYLLNKMEGYWFGAGGHQHRGKLLEIGSAAGYFINHARGRNWEVLGIEPSRVIAEWSRRYLQLNVHNGFFETAPVERGSHDVAVAIEVFEHVRDPRAFLTWINQRLKPRGLVFLTTPNVYSSEYYPPQSTTGILCPLDHLNLFSTETLRAVLEQQGFQVLEIELDGPNGLQLQAFAVKVREAG